MAVMRRFFLTEWFQSFGISLSILYLLLTVMNLIAGLLRSHIGARETLFNHLLETPEYLKLIFPIACLAGSLFCFNRLKRKNELTAALSIGYGCRKIIFDTALAGLSMGFIQFLILSYVGPFLKSKRHFFIKNPESKFKNLKSKGLKTSTIGSGHIWYKNEKYFFSFEAYDRKNNSLSNITAYFHNPSSPKHPSLINKIIKAPKASYSKENGWSMRRARIIRNLDGDGIPQLEDIEGEMTSLPIVEGPEDFKQIEADITTLNIVRLFYYINKLNKNGINVHEYLVLFLEKISSPLTCLIFALVPSFLIFYPQKNHSGLGKNLLFIVAFIPCYWTTKNYFLQLGANSKLNPFIACFGVILLFAPFLTFIFYRHRRLR